MPKNSTPNKKIALVVKARKTHKATAYMHKDWIMEQLQIERYKIKDVYQALVEAGEFSGAYDTFRRIVDEMMKEHPPVDPQTRIDAPVNADSAEPSADSDMNNAPKKPKVTEIEPPRSKRFHSAKIKPDELI